MSEIIAISAYYHTRQVLRNATKVGKGAYSGPVPYNKFMQARMRKRIVAGIREVEKYARLGRLKCVFMAPDIEKVEAAGSCR